MKGFLRGLLLQAGAERCPVYSSGHRGIVVVFCPPEVWHAWGRGRLLQGVAGRFLLHQGFVGKNRKKRKDRINFVLSLLFLFWSALWSPVFRTQLAVRSLPLIQLVVSNTGHKLKYSPVLHREKHSLCVILTCSIQSLMDKLRFLNFPDTLENLPFLEQCRWVQIACLKR